MTNAIKFSDISFTKKSSGFSVHIGGFYWGEISADFDGYYSCCKHNEAATSMLDQYQFILKSNNATLARLKLAKYIMS